MKRYLVKFHWLLSSQFGIEPQRFLQSLRGLASFLRDWLRFRQRYSGHLPSALEHFGLGHYGDPLDPQGHIKGIAHMAALL
jgi:hypothetical protein